MNSKRFIRATVTAKSSGSGTIRIEGHSWPDFMDRPIPISPSIKRRAFRLRWFPIIGWGIFLVACAAYGAFLGWMS